MPGKDDDIGVQDVRAEVRSAASAHAPAVKDDAVADAEITKDVDSFSNKVDNVLHDAGLSRRHLYFCCGGVLILAAMFAIVFFGFKFFSGFVGGFGDGKDSEQIDIPVDEGDDDIVVEPDVSGDQVWVDSSLYGGILVGGDETLEVQGGVEEGTELGEVAETYSDELSYQIEHLGKVINSIDFDVNDYLNDYEDRSQAVGDLLAELTVVYDEGNEILSDLEYGIAELEAKFASDTESKAVYEGEFFAEIEVQDGDDAVTALNSFIEVSKEQIEVKSRYKAMAKIYDLMDRGLAYLEARINDITYNKEALVKGIQVVDVAGSNLDLVVEEELE
ncbi:MAG: hypothetical protein ACD_65C00009G0003 [uncultured bacterium]|nr:MAG: hypothetical protein ACD_65C00009G0003 [uncultured bacterium]KKT01512.1 MAG: hypothetical protein UV80_C0013G0009 [Candidatus Peregrinibacteria bacterium GW2011_GWF2_43_17]KKT19390.1 MAG: hypothetical protein UW03_C0019G0008 [Candidatus Peregrinibacteria bacterium GW2011_GWA2_43_8]HAU40369.1 hypothetical protein [Candidatus Peregrinibacteria bacterium]